MIHDDTLMLWRALTEACETIARETNVDPKQLRHDLCQEARDPKWKENPEYFRLNRPVISPEMVKEFTCPFPPETDL